MPIIGAIEDKTHLERLIDILADAVDDGASVGFLHPLDRDLAREYWLGRITEANRGDRLILGAWVEDILLGTVQLAYPSQENGRCRGEVQRLLVHRCARRRGIGSLLIRALEEAAREQGRQTLFLNTRTGDPPEALYLRLGYTAIGTIPNFALNPDGTLNTTTIMYRLLNP